MNSLLHRAAVLCLVLISFAPTAQAQPDSKGIRIVTWNAREVFNVDTVSQRKDDFKKLADELHPDVVLLQEVTSLKVVEAIRDAMHLEAPYVACSNFNPNDDAEFASFEVGIISKYPLNQVIEYDPSPDNTGERDPHEAPLPDVLSRLGIHSPRTQRGYLWAKIDQLKLTVSVVHLKSSRGKTGLPDKRNAEERECVIAAVAEGVNEDKARLPDYSFLVAGDFNVGNADDSKNGKDLYEDSYKENRHGEDGYDDTHALLSQGLLGDLKMKNLALAIHEPTFVHGFQDAGPIDNIYVDGAMANQFAPAQKAASSFGSDHYPVFTELRIPLRAPMASTAASVADSVALAHRDFLSVCSFNIQFLGSSKVRDDNALASVVADYDIVVVQELIAPPYKGTFPDGEPFKPNPKAADFFDQMKDNGFKYVLSEEDTGKGESLHTNATKTEWWVAFYKPGKVSPAPDLPQGFLAEKHAANNDFDRVPYAFPFRSQDRSVDFVLISVHLRPDSGAENQKRREHELASIAAWVNDHDQKEHDYIILGDMNIQNKNELDEDIPHGFTSLNDECRATNTNVNGPKPYDHVMYRRPTTSREIDEHYDLHVVDLLKEVENFWDSEEPYPGDKENYNHNEFRKYYSDHCPVDFHVRLGGQDDD